jgi:hypothetical protein
MVLPFSSSAMMSAVSFSPGPGPPVKFTLIVLPSSISSTCKIGLKCSDTTATGFENRKSILVSETALHERNIGVSELPPSICAAVSPAPVTQEQTVQKTDAITNGINLTYFILVSLHYIWRKCEKCFIVLLLIMEEFPMLRLDLRAPLLYAEAPGLDPFNCPVPGKRSISKNLTTEDTEFHGEEEYLFCFEIDTDQAARIEPAADCFLGDLVFAGRGNGGRGERTLPAGLYLFTQRRKALCKEEIIHMAIVQQKDGLWERLKPGNCLYVRFLSEDGSPVTQIFRPIYE